MAENGLSAEINSKSFKLEPTTADSTLPPDYLVYDPDHPSGRLATLDELQSKYPGLTPGQYNNVIGPALSDALALPPNEKMSPDQYMVDRYNEIIGVPGPPGHT